MGVSFVREVTGLRTRYAPGATCQRVRVAGVVEGEGVQHCTESTEGVTGVVEEGTRRVSPPTTAEETPEL